MTSIYTTTNLNLYSLYLSTRKAYGVKAYIDRQAGMYSYKQQTKDTDLPWNISHLRTPEMITMDNNFIRPFYLILM